MNIKFDEKHIPHFRKYLLNSGLRKNTVSYYISCLKCTDEWKYQMARQTVMARYVEFVSETGIDELFAQKAINENLSTEEVLKGFIKYLRGLDLARTTVQTYYRAVCSNTSMYKGQKVSAGKHFNNYLQSNGLSAPSDISLASFDSDYQYARLEQKIDFEDNKSSVVQAPTKFLLVFFQDQYGEVTHKLIKDDENAITYLKNYLDDNHPVMIHSIKNVEVE